MNPIFDRQILLDRQDLPDRQTLVRNKARLNAAFRDLRKQGFLAKQDYQCCQSCGMAALGREATALAGKGRAPRGGVFYHGQDLYSLWQDGCFRLSFNGFDAEEASDAALEASDRRVADAAVDTLRRHGVKADWDGNVGRRIVVDLAWPGDEPLT